MTDEERLAALKGRVRRLVETIELVVDVPWGDDDLDTLDLRIEMFESMASPGHFFESMASPGHFSARIWRIEPYRIQSTFPQVSGVPSHEPSDEWILKELESFNCPLEQPVAFPDRDAARDFVLAKLASWLGSVGWDAASDAGDDSEPS